MHHSPSSISSQIHAMSNDAYHTKVEDAFNRHVPKPSNPDVQRFYDLLNALQCPLWDDCTNHSELSVTVRLMSFKSQHNMSQSCFNEIVQLMKEACPSKNSMPSKFSDAKLLRKLGLTFVKIDCCINCYMLYYKEYVHLQQCKFCDAPRYRVHK